MSELNNLKQGEKKALVLIVKDAAGQLVDLSNATLFLGVKAKKSDTGYQFSKEDASFTTTDAAVGQVSVMLSATDTAVAGKFIGELKVTWNAGQAGETIEKSTDFLLYIEQAITA